MSVDKFGHFSKNYDFNNNEKARRKIQKVVGLVLDRDNNLDVQNKRLKNISFPTQEKDAINKHYLQKRNLTITTRFNNIN